MRRIAGVGLVVLTFLAIGLGAQTKAPATFADFGQWEALTSAGSRGGFSPDGTALVYGINRSNRNNELRITRLADGRTTTAAFGAQPVYSADSKWLAYATFQSEAEQERLRNEKKPVQNKLGLMNLGTAEITVFDGIESFSFSPDGAYLAMRRYAPERPGGTTTPTPTPPAGGGGRGGAGGSDVSEDAPGTTLIVRHLGSGRETTFGNIGAIAWQDADKTHLLAMIISAEARIGNGVQVFDPETTSLRVLDSSASVYADLAWRKDSADLAVLRARMDDKREGSTYSVLTWRGLGKSERVRTYDPAADSSFPSGMRTVSFRRLSWSEDGAVVFVGLAKWDEKAVPAGRSGKPAGATGNADQGVAREKDPPPAVDEPATVEIWHSADVFVMPRQKVSAPSDRRRNTLAALHVETGKLVPLGTDAINEQVAPIRHTGFAYVAEWSKYSMNRTIGRPSSDLYLEDIGTATRTRLKDDINDRFVQSGPAGKYLLFLQDDHYWTINVSTRVITSITKTVTTSFVNKESDETITQKPPFGVAGWTRDDGAVLLYDKFDIWEVATDGTKARRLTSGAAEQVRHRFVRLDQDEEFIDLAKPVYVSLFGERTKKSGYGRLTLSGSAERLVWLDKGVSGLAKAKNAEAFAYTAQDYDDSPDIFVGSADLKDAKQVTTTNPFQAKFAWGRSILLEYKTDKGRVLQGALYYPAGYEPGKTYPMIVYLYELLSQNVHRYVAPSDRDYYNTSVFTSQGYFVFQPDIVFTPRQPGVSVVQCVTAGIKKVIQLGVVDPKRVGVIGHSMGGFDSAFLATHTNGVFAAAVAGAPITDLVSYYGDHHWSSGIAETDHIETGQERMEVALYEDFKAYVDNSAVFNVHNMTVPLLLEAGDSDGTVAWHQSIELYNIARRAKKNVVMAAYIGEDHGLRQKKNQVDYQRRILAWFGHYLKGAAAEGWIASGQSFLDREAEVKRLTIKK